MFQPRYNLEDDTIEVSEGLAFPYWQVHVVADGVTLYPDQDKDQTDLVRKAKTLALEVDGNQYPIPAYDQLTDEDFIGYLDEVLYPM